MRYLILTIILFCTFQVYPQRILTIEECISTAHDNSLTAEQAKNKYLESYYQYKIYKKSIYPNLSFSGTIPALNRSISKITLPDGTEAFISQSTGNYSGSLKINQPIPLTGGDLFVSTGLQRLDIYGENSVTSYLANPINIGFSQNLFSYNPYKWDKKTEPLQYEISRKEYVKELENISLKAIELFFNLLQAQIAYEVKLINKNNSDTLLFITHEAFKAGKITEDEFLQIEINNMNLALELEELDNKLLENSKVLVDFLNLPENENIEVIPPKIISVSYILKDDVLNYAKENGNLFEVNRLRLLEAERNLARVKSERGFSVDIYATFGLSKSDYQFSNVYKNPLDQEQVTVSLNIPILDWNISKYNRKIAEIGIQEANLVNNKSELEFIQQISSAVNEFNIQSKQIGIVERTVELSQKRYEMSKERFINGKISFLDYYMSQNEKDNALIDYINSLQKSWSNYYKLRELTLYDFEKKQRIEINIDFD